MRAPSAARRPAPALRTTTRWPSPHEHTGHRYHVLCCLGAQALDVFEVRGEQTALPPDTHSHAAAIAACAKGKRSEEALQLLEQMQARSPRDRPPVPLPISTQGSTA